MVESQTPYPVRVDAAVEPAASRGLWLVKWLLLIPHYIVLAFLWLGFVVVAFIAFFAILFTGRYPRALFDYNLGVLRWSWRVHYYGYGALGTDRYPPFTLADVPDYPAHLDVAYPERLSRGLVLVKWWLLAIPHYIIVAVFVGGGAWFGTRNDRWNSGWGAGGLVGLLVLIAAVVLLFSGRYPRSLYNFVLGMDRWALRVAAYASLMTDEYPPFRLDMGGPDPGSVAPGPVAPLPAGGAAAVPAAPAGPPRPSGWTAGRIVAVVAGAVLLFAAAGTLLGGGALLWADRTQRSGGYVWTPTAQISTGTYAVTTDSVELTGSGLEWAVDHVIGTSRVQVRAPAGGPDIFVGLGRTSDVTAYLQSVRYDRLQSMELRGGRGAGGAWVVTSEHPGGAPSVPPGRAGIWVASSTGTGTRVVDWRPADGSWTLVVMRADGGAGLTASARLGLTAPGLAWVAGIVLGVGVVLLVVGGLLVGLASAAAASSTRPDGQPPVVPVARTASDTEREKSSIEGS